ncbi:MAG: hypothetical protein IPG76_22485 [Acidobacteria bacterium]|nr:hypothetical protein [Acidobacteriota bacterium]
MRVLIEGRRVREIAKAQAEAGEKDAATITFEAAKEMAGAIEYVETKAIVLSEIAQTQAESGEKNAAMITIEAVKGMAGVMKDAWIKAGR